MGSSHQDFYPNVPFFQDRVIKPGELLSTFLKRNKKLKLSQITKMCKSDSIKNYYCEAEENWWGLSENNVMCKEEAGGGKSTKKVRITNIGKEAVIKIVMLLDQDFSLLTSIFYVDFQFFLLSYLMSFWIFYSEE